MLGYRQGTRGRQIKVVRRDIKGREQAARGEDDKGETGGGREAEKNQGGTVEEEKGGGCGCC